MPKTYFLLLALIFTLNANCFAQISSSDLKLINNTAVYKDGKNELVKVLAKNIRLPQGAVADRKLITVIGIIKIGKTGEIVDIGTLHKVDDVYLEAFKNVIVKTKGKWQVSNDTANFFYAVIPVQFDYQNSGYTLFETNKPSYFHETIVLTIAGRPGAFAGVYENLESDLVTQVNELYKNADYTEAASQMAKLVNLQPLHTAYYDSMIDLLHKTGRTDEAQHYEQVKKLLSNQ